MKNSDTEAHESYGMVGLSRVSIGPPGINLFGSSIRHANIIMLTIRRAKKERNLSNDWFYGQEEMVEVMLSAAQFAELITTLNVGHGVPCTIRRIGTQLMEPSPEVSKRQIFQDELEEHVRSVMRDATTLVAEIREAHKAKKGLTLDIVNRVELLAQHINSNLPFLHEQFNAAMDKTVTAAKAEVEEFITAKIHSLGVNALTEEIERALMAPAKSEAFLLASADVEDVMTATSTLQ